MPDVFCCWQWDHPKALITWRFVWYEHHQLRRTLFPAHKSSDRQLLSSNQSSNHSRQLLLGFLGIHSHDHIHRSHVIVPWNRALVDESQQLKGPRTLIFHLLLHQWVYWYDLPPIAVSLDHELLVDWSHGGIIVDIEDRVIGDRVALRLLVEGAKRGVFL